jgi:Leucine-rich repeat (LRR) protein
MRLLFVLFLISLWSNFFSQKEILVTYKWSEVQGANPDTIFSISFAKEKLSELPVQLWKFKKLKALNLQRNRLEDLPDSLEQLTEIEFLDISHNKFAVFPLPITRLYKLKVLKASSNKLNYISNNIENCDKLEEIDLFNNIIEDLGKGIYKLNELRLLDLRGVMYGTIFQSQLKASLPNVKIKMDPPCKCMD